MQRCGGLTLAVIVLAAGCVSATAPPTRQVAADATDGEFSLSPYEWDGKINAGESVRLVNRFGNLRVRSAVEGRVVVTGAIQRFAGDDRDIDVALHRTGNGFTIEVIEVELASDTSAPSTQRGSNGHFDGRIDIAVLLPDTAALDAETSDGKIQLRSYRGPATLTSVSGDIAAYTPASVVARSASGSLDIQFPEIKWSRGSKLVTQTGDIKVGVPASADLRIDASTGGHLTASVDDTASDNNNGRLRKTLGTGANRLEIRSRTGSIALQQR